ncbi:MAG TPA: 23S rRNA (uracil(1939)-C(5))-methyltransferase RlmD [Lachnospiraceae bacterium]|nr:23S rRNA (uracil(1939)-C(5))-methyltransferase RlmD [Lachnospiraceae bacterium]
MKKGQEYTGTVQCVRFPDRGVVRVMSDEGEEELCTVKGVLPGQRIRLRVTKKRGGRCEGVVLEVTERAPREIMPVCPHFGVCGGCSFLNLPYEEQLKLKEEQIRSLMHEVRLSSGCRAEGAGEDVSAVPGAEKGKWFDEIWEGIRPSPAPLEYRNKMEFSFGDMSKGGELELGLHKKGSYYDVVTVDGCRIVDEDFRSILKETLSFFRKEGIGYFHRQSHTGYLRHLLIRKGARTGEILAGLVTTSQEPGDRPLEGWCRLLLSLKLKGRLVGILHITNDSVADAVKSEKTRLLYGRDHFFEELSGLRFKITPFSFFQTNTLSAEVVYSAALEYISSCSFPEASVIYDLYCGTGTITQLVSRAAGKVIGVELIEEAVRAAGENAALNGLHNCEFVAGDVLKVLDGIAEKPELIILDPPRDGIHPKAIYRIMDYGVRNILYISCKPTSLARDLEIFAAHSYLPVRMCAVDQFPASAAVECIALLERADS